MSARDQASASGPAHVSQHDENHRLAISWYASNLTRCFLATFLLSQTLLLIHAVASCISFARLACRCSLRGST